MVTIPVKEEWKNMKSISGLKVVMETEDYMSIHW